MYKGPASIRLGVLAKNETEAGEASYILWNQAFGVTKDVKISIYSPGIIGQLRSWIHYKFL